MLNKTIFRHTLKSNLKIWAVITFVLILMNTVLIGVFNPSTIASLTDLVKGTALTNILGNASFMGMLSQTFYSLQGVILLLIYVIVTAGSLVVSQVDSGSMAYILATPIKRMTFVRTQAAYLFLALFTMISIVTLTGLVAIQVFHGGVLSGSYTEDIAAISKKLNINKDELNSNLSLILENEEAVKIGANERKVDSVTYEMYIKLKMNENAYTKAAEIMGVDSSEIANSPSIIASNPAALESAAKIMGMDKDTYKTYLETVELQLPKIKALQGSFIKGVSAAAEVMGIESSEVLADLSLLESNPNAVNAAVSASGLPKDMFFTLVDNQISSKLLGEDKGILFDINTYIMLNLGLFLLMFATSGISFMFSSLFNLSKNYMALGAGIPLAFYLFKMMDQVSDSLDVIKYFTLNTLFDTKTILNGSGYGLSFFALFIVGITLYTLGMTFFTRRDLPL
ncbi:MAG: hypothetical protein C3F13_16395 [Anaerolineales bacterium]|nr:MAG: hypothetical protein C3F13_16395 [Anaerolineales bacterium]